MHALVGLVFLKNIQGYRVLLVVGQDLSQTVVGGFGHHQKAVKLLVPEIQASDAIVAFEVLLE